MKTIKQGFRFPVSNLHFISSYPTTYVTKTEAPMKKSWKGNIVDVQLFNHFDTKGPTYLSDYLLYFILIYVICPMLPGRISLFIFMIFYITLHILHYSTMFLSIAYFASGNVIIYMIIWYRTLSQSRRNIYIYNLFILFWKKEHDMPRGDPHAF